MKYVPYGDFSIVVVLSYLDETGWHNAVGEKSLHINSWYEEHEKFLNYLGIFLIFISYLLTFDEIRRPLWEKLKGLIIQFFQYIKK